ncbi:hypothetical protein JCM18899A_25980 [Nocardioides sp. AN3]
MGAWCGLLLLGALVGLCAVWVHGRWWALGLAAVATLVTELAVARGVPRIAYAAGWVAASTYFLLARPEGDFAVGSDPVGYTFLALGLVVLVLAVTTNPPRRRSGTTTTPRLHARAGDSA